MVLAIVRSDDYRDIPVMSHFCNCYICGEKSSSGFGKVKLGMLTETYTHYGGLKSIRHRSF